MNPISANRDRTHARQGIALVIVLGFLAVLTLMAISFVIHMRTERLTSTAYVNGVQARQLIDVAVARTLAIVDQDLVGNGLNAPNYAYLYPQDFPAGPDYPLTGVGIDLWTGEAKRFLPRIPGQPAPQTSRFVEIPDPLAPTNTIGRYAFLAFNLTGLLDINEVGTADTRGEGNQAGEIRVAPELNPEVNAGQWTVFKDDLTNEWRRIETYNEFLAIGRSRGYLNVNAITNALNPRNSFYLFGRSKAERDPDGQQKINLDGVDRTILETDAFNTNLLAKLIDCGIPDPDNALAMLADFVDPDSLPDAFGVDGYAAEAFPMINELILTNALRKTPAGVNTAYVHRVEVIVEIWNPFTETKSIKVDMSGLTVNFPNMVPAILIPNNTVVGSMSSPNLASITLGPGQFTAMTNTYVSNPYVAPAPPGFAGSPPNTMAVVVQLGGRVEVRLEQEGDAVVDRVDFSALNVPLGTFLLRMDNAISGPLNVWYGDAGSTKNLAVDDPRLNYLTPVAANATAPGWRADNRPSPGAINPRALDAANASGEGDGSSLPALYVRNRSFSQSEPGGIAELGYLPLRTNLAWRTVSLYELNGVATNLHPVLDYFTAVGSDTRRIGTVSLNGLNADALASVFNEAPINERPGGTVLARITAPLAQTIASDLIGLDKTNANLSVLGRIQSLWDNNANPRDTDDLRESNIRNSLGLVTTRQNLFGIVVEAQSLGERPPHGGAGPVTGSERALLIVWRDPTLNPETGVHDMEVRYFTWLR